GPPLRSGPAGDGGETGGRRPVWVRLPPWPLLSRCVPSLSSPSARTPRRLTPAPSVTHNLCAHGKTRNRFAGALRSVPGAVAPYVSYAPGHAADQHQAYRQLEDREGAWAYRAADIARRRRTGPRMRRRVCLPLLAVCVAALPLAAAAQQ